MELAAQREAQGVLEPGAALSGDWRRERVPARSGALVEAKQEAPYWRSMHARVQERVAKRQAQCREAERKLADAQERIGQLERRERELEQENAGLQQRNQDLLKAPFGKRSEKRQSDSDGGPGTGSTDPGQGPQRSRGGQAGADAHARVDLPLVVNHARYLILPWILLPSLASHLLACLQRQLPRDWHQRYGIRPVLLETFCETPRFHGTCYRAANWIHLGQTQGRGKLDTRHEYAEPVKNVFVKPLCPDWKAILNR